MTGQWSWEVSTEVGGGNVHIGKVLLCGSSDGDVVWGGDVGDIGANGAEVIGGTCGFPSTGNKVKGKVSEIRVVAEGGGEQSTSGNGGTTDLGLLGKQTGYSGGVGGPTEYF